MAPYPEPTPILFQVADDDDANRVSAVLEALGYAPQRKLEALPSKSQLAYVLDRIVRRHKLTSREDAVLRHITAGTSYPDIAKALKVSRATVKWYAHNVFAKTCTNGREDLLRFVLKAAGLHP